ncbi:hypothetical protein IAT38_001811 [Cryptococcus sp. DSM 104549]
MESTVDGIMDSVLAVDPYLQYQPAFSYTLPIQLLVNGITLTLLCVLLIHLLFTTQYHYPLAPLNYILQLLSILVVVISVIIKIVIILQYCSDSADTWPYSLDYVAVTIPPKSWSTGQNAAWFLLQALNNGLSNITHIQFLTLLYPSRTEARLIIFILGPLAVVSSALVFSALSGSQPVLDVSDAIRNVLNSTLLLIFTISLALWGLFVNRRRAWRFDGGTAVFGVGSLFLAAISTSFNFVAVAEDGIDWLQHLLFAAVLWQIWLGWWWWVGSGMGIGEVEDIMERQERKKRKQAKQAARARTAAAQGKSAPPGALDSRRRANSLAGIADGFTSGVTSILRTSRSGTLTRRQTMRSTTDEGLAEEGAIEMDELGQRRREGRGDGAAAGGSGSGSGSGSGDQHVEFEDQGDIAGESNNSASRGIQQSTNSETSSTSATPSLHAPRSVGQLFSYPTTWLVVYMRRLRKAHQEAAKNAAIERAERRQRVFAESDWNEAGRRDASRLEAGVVSGDDVGWGLGRFGIREHEESARRLREADENLSEGRLLGDQRRERSREGSRERSSQERARGEPTPGRPRDGGETTEGEWEDIDSSTSSSENRRGRRSKRRRGQGGDGANEGEDGRRQQGGSGWSWWGPLRDWRLADRSTF